MYKNNQYLSNESIKVGRIGQGNEKSCSYNLEDVRQRSITGLSSHVDSYAEQRLIEIKRKHGIKDKVSKDPCEAKPLQEITLRSSNYNNFKSNNKD